MTFNNIFRLLTLSIFVFASVGCERVIDVDLEDAEPKMVVEAYLTDQQGSASVKLSRSISYFESQAIPLVLGATVTLADDLGGSWTLTEVQPGTYVHDSLAGTPGRTYTLKIVLGTETVTGTAFMPQPVPIDSVVSEVLTRPGGGGGSDFTILRTYYNDLGERANFYRSILAINGVAGTDINVFDDRSNNGISTAAPVFSDAIESGDTVTVSMWSIDRTNFFYYNGLADNLSGGTGSAAPGNPDTNLSGDALGVFTAGSESKSTIVIP